MANFRTQISWTDSTLNPTTGCTKVSAGCEHCYAEALTIRLFGGDFGTVKFWPERLDQVAAMGPLVGGNGQLRPRRVFVNSMSDLFHRDIDDPFRDRCFDRFEQQEGAAFQILTKRGMTMGRYIEARYGKRGVPAHIWLGVSCEDNKVKQRLDQLRRLKGAVGNFTAFVSVEPLIGPCDQHDYKDLDWILIGGESGGGARIMQVDWARTALRLARSAGAAVWFKQFGIWKSNPLYVNARAPDHLGRVRQAIRAGELAAHIERDPKSGRYVVKGEKGGATLDGSLHHEHPPAYHAQARRLNAMHAPQ